MNSYQIPEEVIQLVLERTNIVELTGRYVQLTKQGKYYKGLCPFHSEKTPSFTVTPDKGIYHCFGCGNGGSVINLLMEIDGLTFPEAVTELAEQAEIPITWNKMNMGKTASPEQSLRSKLLKAHELSAKFYHFILKNTLHGKQAMEYLEQRGITRQWIDLFQIGYAPSAWETLREFLEQRSFSLPDMEKGGCFQNVKMAVDISIVFEAELCSLFSIVKAKRLHFPEERWGRTILNI